MSRTLKNWQSRGLAILAIGGGAIGLAWTMIAVQRQGVAPGMLLPLLLGVAFFLWGVWCGLQMLSGSRRALFRNTLFWLVQVPVLQTPVFGYAASCGAMFQVLAKWPPLELKLNFSVLSGQFAFNLGQAGLPGVVGANLFALGIAIWLMRQYEAGEPALAAATAP